MKHNSAYFPPAKEADPYNFVHDLRGHFENWKKELGSLYRIWFIPPTTPDWVKITVVASVVEKRVKQFEGAGCKNVTVEKILHRGAIPLSRAQRISATDKGI